MIATKCIPLLSPASSLALGVVPRKHKIEKVLDRIAGAPVVKFKDFSSIAAVADAIARTGTANRMRRLFSAAAPAPAQYAALEGS